VGEGEGMNYFTLRVTERKLGEEGEGPDLGHALIEVRLRTDGTSQSRVPCAYLL
jgi:hypothetical protein